MVGFKIDFSLQGAPPPATPAGELRPPGPPLVLALNTNTQLKHRDKSHTVHRRALSERQLGKLCIIHCS